MSKIIIFQDHGARIIQGVGGEAFRNFPNVLIDPPDSALPKGISPSYWKLVNGQVTVMDELEQKRVDNALNGGDKRNTEIVLNLLEIRKDQYFHLIVVSLLTSGGFSLLFGSCLYFLLRAH